MIILVVGGAGYIGSHMVKLLAESGYDVVILDNLSSGFQDAVLYGEFIKGDVGEINDVEMVFSKLKIDAVMHFGSSIDVAESIRYPDKYYRNNLINTINLLDVMLKHNCKKFIFSSTAATFGNPMYLPIDENHPQNPINPYGRSKLMIEQILIDYEKAYGFKSVCLRYFNAAGADPDSLLGERHNPETHLIPLILQVASGRREFIEIFGNNYDTRDGTCIRDFIHVVDLCSAHLLALRYLDENMASNCFNLGNGNGFTVGEVIQVCKEITDRQINVKILQRRNGDPANLVADSTKAKRILGWAPIYSDLKNIITHAWNWEVKLNKFI